MILTFYYIQNMPSNSAYDIVCNMLYIEPEFQKIFLNNFNKKENYISSQVCKSWNNIIKNTLNEEYVKYVINSINLIITNIVLIKTNVYIIPFYLNSSYDIDTYNNNLLKFINYIPEYKKEIVKLNIIEVYKTLICETKKCIDGEEYLYEYIIYYYLKILCDHFNTNINDLPDNVIKIYNKGLLQEEQDNYDMHNLLENEELYDDYNDY